MTPSIAQAEVVFWLSAGLAGFVYAGYPILLVLLRLVIRRPIHKEAIEPTVSLLVAAYNEADVIEAKVRNALELDYPPDRLEVIIASDGSTDGTAEMVARLADGDRVRLFAYPRNRGKLAVLNETVPRTRGEIVAFSDASTMLAPDALRRLVASFADPTVGAVSGIYRVTKLEAASLGKPEDLYWRYETFLKAQEAALSSVVGAHGALYAVRKELYPFPPSETINDDYVIAVRVLERGYRVAYEPKAVSYEEAHEMAGFGRRVRIMRGNLQQLRELRGLLRPVRPLPLLFFLCHKVGRLAVPPAMVTLLVSNAYLFPYSFYTWTFGLQCLFYGLAAAGAVWTLGPALLRIPYYFCLINAAALLALYRASRGRPHTAWS